MITIKSVIISLLISLFSTEIYEVLISIMLGIREKRDIKVVILANLITNPIVVYTANLLLIKSNYIVLNTVIIIMEVLVVIGEALIYKKYLKYDKKSPWIISLINNFLSFTIGNIINIII